MDPARLTQRFLVVEITGKWYQPADFATEADAYDWIDLQYSVPTDTDLPPLYGVMPVTRVARPA